MMCLERLGSFSRLFSTLWLFEVPGLPAFLVLKRHTGWYYPLLVLRLEPEPEPELEPELELELASQLELN